MESRPSRMLSLLSRWEHGNVLCSAVPVLTLRRKVFSCLARHLSVLVASLMYNLTPTSLMVSSPAVMERLCEGSESELSMDSGPAILCLSLLPDCREPGDCWSGVKLTRETGSVRTADPMFVLQLCGASTTRTRTSRPAVWPCCLWGP